MIKNREGIEAEERQRLDAMQGQIGEMKNDYEDMLRAREETRKQLLAKFQDIHRKIKSNRDFTTSEVKRVKDTLKAFESKFFNQMRILREEFEKKTSEFRELNRERLEATAERMDKIEEAILKEREDRIRETEEAVGRVKGDLDVVQEEFDTEQTTRIEREKEIKQILEDDGYELDKTIDKEKTERNLEVGGFKDQSLDRLKQYKKSIVEFQKDSMDNFYRMREELEAEMDDRFDAQDEIVDNLSNSIKTFQDTLKKMGENI